METTAARKEVPTSLLEEAWASLEVTKTVPEESLVEVKAVFTELHSNYFAKEGTPTQGNQIYAWDSWNLAREEKSVEIMACWRDDNKALFHKIFSLETKLFKLCQRKVMRIRVKGRIMAGWNGWIWIHHIHVIKLTSAVCSDELLKIHQYLFKAGGSVFS
ncbi:hypothetical protein DSO57_1001064 [Entomophthora muscae]|uniref:Uncharacterized protein n=1 Tax=Entomophthora muscae TaxID=34485 RepID=A0ACC2RP61_9FUNG|nr:hypothetical protein DSO57_1001064 [Entomophthora muscae]